MTTGLPYLSLAIVLAVFIGIFWWMYSLSSRTHAQRKLELSSRKISQQPWDDNRRGSR